MEINPADAAKHDIADGGRVKIASRRAEIEADARVTERVPEGMLYMPFHYADGAANWLTSSEVDPITKTPEYKVCAAKIAKAAVQVGEAKKRQRKLRRPLSLTAKKMRFISAVILAGGQSTRMGFDKQLLQQEGSSIVGHQIAVLSAYFSDIMVASPPTPPELYACLPVRVIEDIHTGIGPLGGIHAALTKARG